MEIYLAVFGVMAALVPADRLRLTSHSQDVLMLVPFLLLLSMTGTRWETGNDWAPYLEYYESLQRLGDNAENFEFGYRSLAWASKSVGLGYGAFVFFCSMLYLGMFFLTFRGQNGALALILLFYCTYLLGWMGTARQVLALGLTACAAECLLKGRQKTFLSLVLLATSFHQTAVIFLLASILPRRLASTTTYLVLFFASGAIGQALALVLPAILDALVGVEGIGAKVLFYGQVGAEDLNQASGALLTSLWYLKRLAFLGFFLWLRGEFISARNAFYFNAYVVSVLIFLLLEPSLPILAIRGSNFFSIYELFLLASLVRSPGRWALLAIPFVLILSAQRLYTSIYAYHPDLYVPYKGLFINEDVRREVY